jgi:hypothetical protein
MSNSKSNRPSEYVKRSYTQKISEVNRKLRFGDVTRVAESTGFSTNYVSEVLSGLYNNERIVNEAYDIARGRMSNVTKLSVLETALSA